MTVRAEERVFVAAPPEVVWDAVVDWESQSEWVALTTVTVDTWADGNAAEVGPARRGVGECFTAVTALGPLGFADPMRVTRWEPPTRVDVLHLGRVVRGTGTFQVESAPGGAYFVWREDLVVPLGPVGRLGFRLVWPLAAVFLRRSLRRMARLVETGAEERR